MLPLFLFFFLLLLGRRLPTHTGLRLGYVQGPFTNRWQLVQTDPIFQHAMCYLRPHQGKRFPCSTGLPIDLQCLAIQPQIWNTRNHFIFAHPDHVPAELSKRAFAFVVHFRQAHQLEPTLTMSHPCSWRPLDHSIYKLNFDAGQVGNLATEQRSSFKGPDVEEALVCLFGVKYALESGIKNLIVEGVYLSLINSLKKKR
ncbi:hypothetical protein Cgig2_017666 [Carnegiea gigantea]|uniref:RNase H type-1 domain-containing protein n=1 Tax=Carnegiea gigantea TaxID=171969 RepID=A0A9Q1QBB1_9CARY|nr:hypothetical protein Cgig2_017666 [Carnegiea gigantea]